MPLVGEYREALEKNLKREATEKEVNAFIQYVTNRQKNKMLEEYAIDFVKEHTQGCC